MDGWWLIVGIVGVTLWAVSQGGWRWAWLALVLFVAVLVGEIIYSDWNRGLLGNGPYRGQFAVYATPDIESSDYTNPDKSHLVAGPFPNGAMSECVRIAERLNQTTGGNFECDPYP